MTVVVRLSHSCTSCSTDFLHRPNSFGSPSFRFRRHLDDRLHLPQQRLETYILCRLRLFLLWWRWRCQQGPWPIVIARPPQVCARMARSSMFSELFPSSDSLYLPARSSLSFLWWVPVFWCLCLHLYCRICVFVYLCICVSMLLCTRSLHFLCDISFLLFCWFCT